MPRTPPRKTTTSRRGAPRGRRAAQARRPRRRSYRSLERGAKQRLARFRQGSAVAVAVTGLAILLWGDPSAAEAPPADEVAATAPEEAPRNETARDRAAESAEEATGTIRELALWLYEMLPRLGIALALLVVAWLLTRLLRPVLRRALRSWERAEAVSALWGVGVWLLALGAAVSVLAGDARALLGSVGLFGLALSWALQGPIESFSGWLLNSFRGYYRVGDRIEVGDVFGDVVLIDVLNTMVWEAGGPDKPVKGAQATGALITFPNSEVLRANIVNYTRDFPYVWDEVTVGVTNESDLALAARVVKEAATDALGPEMVSASERYAENLRRRGLEVDIEPLPQVYVSPTDAWTNITVRYVVGARERRRTASNLFLALSVALARPEHEGRIRGALPRQQVELRTLDPED